MLISYSKFFFFFKKKLNLSYLIFLIFLDEKLWIFFLFDFFYNFINKIISFYKKKSNGSNFNFFDYLCLYKSNIFSKFFFKLDFFLINLKNYCYDYIYYFLKQLFFLYKFFFFSFFNFFFFNYFNKYIVLNKYFFFINSVNKFFSFFNLNFKISFYYLYKKNQSIYFNKFFFFDKTLYESYNINFFFIKYNNLLNNYDTFINNFKKKNDLNSFLVYKNNNFLNNFFFFLNNFNLLWSIFFYIFFSNKFITNYLFKNNICENITVNDYFFFIINYDNKSIQLSNNIFTFFLFYYKKSKDIFFKKKIKYTLKKINTLYSSFIITDFLFFYKLIFYFFKIKFYLKDTDWLMIYNFYYNKLINLKYLALYFYFINKNMYSVKYNNKYNLLYFNLKYNKFLEKKKVTNKIKEFNFWNYKLNKKIELSYNKKKIHQEFKIRNLNFKKKRKHKKFKIEKLKLK